MNFWCFGGIRTSLTRPFETTKKIKDPFVIHEVISLIAHAILKDQMVWYRFSGWKRHQLNFKVYSETLRETSETTVAYSSLSERETEKSRFFASKSLYKSCLVLGCRPLILLMSAEILLNKISETCSKAGQDLQKACRNPQPMSRSSVTVHAQRVLACLAEFNGNPL